MSITKLAAEAEAAVEGAAIDVGVCRRSQRERRSTRACLARGMFQF